MNTLKDFLVQTHCDNNGNMSWMRVACSVILLTGVLTIIVQLAMCRNVEDLHYIEWMQPVTLIGVALTGKTAQKKLEKE